MPPPRLGVFLPETSAELSRSVGVLSESRVKLRVDPDKEASLLRSRGERGIVVVKGNREAKTAKTATPRRVPASSASNDVGE